MLMSEIQYLPVIMMFCFPSLFTIFFSSKLFSFSVCFDPLSFILEAFLKCLAILGSLLYSRLKDLKSWL